MPFNSIETHAANLVDVILGTGTCTTKGSKKEIEQYAIDLKGVLESKGWEWKHED